ncbi:chitobiase/beta-hexosaminidase C-terminal domain-containing protein [uncultured Muribaculum sp.]|uniref:InlB B-repeat-containing protein n=1 Tax=uncultured Muribaculum sp. TaxID=1918613 RepID=UPI0026000D8B|nr:chitobiase/beta-hexosaminidase C-terminal domain-containing protein [uncultured Muribaculum sp.]
MKHLALFIVAILYCVTGFAQGGYDPENPGDPNPYRRLTVLASPKAGGSVGTYNDSQVGVGQTVSCYANENKYYDFVHWLKNGEIVSTESNYSFVMPDENVEIVAVFELHYNPESPDDPQEARPSHRITLTASPGKGGRFNSPVFKLCEGDTAHIYAYPNEGYRFEEWLLDGALVSTKNPLQIKMTDRDLHYTARFSYNPINPTDPSVNLFNPGTGEMVVDRFEQGYLSSAISRLLNDDYEYSSIQSLLVSGMMDGSDFGVMYNLSNCAVIDLSRTNGYAGIPSYAFESMTALTDLLLPSCINSIGRYAFQDCKNLSVITCYAVIPPSLEYGVFDGVDRSVVIKVPSQSVDLYKNAQGWKDFTILPADANVFSISVSLPQDAKDGRYKNMGIELLNTSNGQRYKYLITDKAEYVFGNLLSSTKYSVSVKNTKNEILGEISDLEIIDKDLTVAFRNLRQPQNVSVKVMTPAGNDVTSETTIKWFNDANELLHQGSTLVGVLENSVVSYDVILPQHLQQFYIQPSSQTITVSGQNALACTLEELGKSILKGKICDTDDNVINTAIITISKKINGTYSNSEIAQCDDNGNYELEVPDVPLKVTVSANGHISQTKELEAASIGLGDIQLEKITGITIIPSYSIQKVDTEGEETQNSNWLIDDTNVAYRVENPDGNEIPGCVYQSGVIVLPESINMGDQLNIVAYSKSNQFKDTRQSIVVTSKNTYVTIPIVKYGGVDITANCDATTSNICLLYNADGKQVGKAALRNNSASFFNLPDGKYSIVSMRKSELLGSVTNLSSLRQTQLEQGSDYLLSNVDVTSGKISNVVIGNIPDLDEAKMYYTNNRETYFMSNKTQLTIGNYVTLKTKITVKDEYADMIDAATLVVDIPSNCEFVDNSIISGSGYLGYEYADNRLTIPIQNLSDAVRFCVVPIEGGTCKPNAFVKLIVDNQEVLQPIGSAYFEAQNFNLAAPKKTSKTTIAVRGTATADSEVKIYDNDRLVGTTYSMPNGEWAMKISLVKPYSFSLHHIHAEITNSEGRRLLTETRTVDYNQSYADLSTITMAYGKERFVFDQINGRTNVSNYIYWVHPDEHGYQPTPKFTFIADFTNNNLDVISNVLFKVKMLNGSIRYLSGEYNEISGNWVATSSFSETQAPVNVACDFDVAIDENVYCEEAFNDQISGLINATNHLLEEFENNVSLTANIDEDDRFEGYLVYGNYRLPYSVMSLDYDDVYGRLMNEKQFYMYEIEGDKIFYNIESTDTKMIYTVADSNEKMALSIMVGVDDVQNNGMKRAINWDWIRPMRESFNNGSFLRHFSGGMGILLDIFSMAEYINVRGDFNLMMDNAVKYANKFEQLNANTKDLILAQCKNGDYRLGRTQMQLADIDRLYLRDRTSEFSDRYYQYLTDYKWALGWNVAGNIASLGVGKLIGKADKFIKGKGECVIRWYNRHINNTANADVVAETMTNSLGIAYNAVQNGVSETINPAFYDFDGVRDKLWLWSNTEFLSISNEYSDLDEKIKRAYHNCPEDEQEDDDNDDDGGNDDDDFPTPPIIPSIDPSGYVYEAVPSNRISGVTATAYYKQQDEDMYGDITETAVVWDAAPFGQENPLTTDAQGMYAWDVPAGMWQVRFEKDGYEAAQSEWLPVPPPQLDVNIAMTQAKQPEVKAVHAYSDGVTIEFDKFMLPSTMTLGNIIVTQDGRMIDGNIVASDIEMDINGNSFCSKIEYKPATPFAEGIATVFVSKAVKSYANINMGEDFMQTFSIEPRISDIEVIRNIDVYSGSTVTVDASILPSTAAQGKTVTIESLNPLIATVSIEQVEIGGNGNISFDISGLIIGSTGIKLSIEDYDIDVTIGVNVMTPREEPQVATPRASIESGEVMVGTEVYLSCETENASIYYTIDGSCPCDVDRILYTGAPIVITTDVTLKVIAEADGMIESEIAEYQYTVNPSGIGDIQINNDLSIYPLPLGEYLNISNGDIAIDSVSMFDINGKMILHSDKSEKQVSLKVGFLTPGVYILNVKTNGQSIVKKVVKL